MNRTGTTLLEYQFSFELQRWTSVHSRWTEKMLASSVSVVRTELSSFDSLDCCSFLSRKDTIKLLTPARASTVKCTLNCMSYYGSASPWILRDYSFLMQSKLENYATHK